MEQEVYYNMTREEAIKELIDFKDKSWDGMPEEVIDVAIEALKQEPCVDAISRQDAINAIWDGVNMDIYTREVKETLEALPSVTAKEV